MSVVVELSGGERGEAVSLSGELLTIIAPKAFAPGAPVSFSIESAALQAKSRGSRQRDDGRFDVRVRLVNLTRDDRAHLERLLSDG